MSGENPAGKEESADYGDPKYVDYDRPAES